MVKFPGFSDFLQNHGDFHVLSLTDYCELKPYRVNGSYYLKRLRNCGGDQVIMAHGNSDISPSGTCGQKIQSFRRQQEKK